MVKHNQNLLVSETPTRSGKKDKQLALSGDSTAARYASSTRCTQRDLRWQWPTFGCHRATSSLPVAQGFLA